ncbi:MAG: pilus assembly protein TadG-related protein [Gemmata sp.]
MLARARTRAPRRGQIAMVSIFGLLTMLLLVAAITNASRAAVSKVDGQNAADASAHAGAVQLARGMNAVTALNHLISELNALNALVMSFGGLELEDRKPYRIANAAEWVLLQKSYATAVEWNGFRLPEGRKILADGPTSKSGAAIGRSRARLLDWLQAAYLTHAAGGVMMMEAAVNLFSLPQGNVIVRESVLIQKNVVREWEILEYLEDLAEGPLLDLKHVVNPMRKSAGSVGLITLLYEYCEKVVKESPKRAEQAAAAVARDVGCTGTLFPTTRGGKYTLELPLVKERIKEGDPATHWRSQMVRGMTPWVQYWRKPILVFGEIALPMSRFAHHYHDESNEFTLNMAWWQWKENKTRLFVIKDLNVAGPDKGKEPWTKRDGSRRLDELFAIVGLAHQPAPTVIGFPLFRQYQPDGFVAQAQALVYNASPQDRPRRDEWQPVVGWDTLAWDADVPEYEFGEKYANFRNLTEQPRMKINWQAKLVPGTRIGDAVGTQTAPVNKVLGRTKADTALANTH